MISIQLIKLKIHIGMILIAIHLLSPNNNPKQSLQHIKDYLEEYKELN